MGLQKTEKEVTKKKMKNRTRSPNKVTKMRLKERSQRKCQKDTKKEKHLHTKNREQKINKIGD